MKNIIATLMCVLLMSSCNDFFDITPTGSVPHENYEVKLNNLRITLNSLYALLQSEGYQQSELIFGECMSDNAYTAQDNSGGELGQLLNFEFNTENSFIKSRYELNFRGINIANQIISATPKVIYNANYPEGAKEIREVLGQAKLFRALFYFMAKCIYIAIHIFLVFLN